MKFGSITTGIVSDGLVFNMDAANRASCIPSTNTTQSFNTLDLTQTGSFINDTLWDNSTITPSFAFDGVADYINCGTLTSITDNVNQLSIVFWFKIDNTGENRLVGIFNSTSRWISCQLNSNSYIYYVIANGGLTYGGFEAISSGLVVADTWYNLACVFDGTQSDNAGRCKIYLNADSKTLTFTGTIPSTTYDFSSLGSPPEWNVGGDGSDPPDNTDGNIGPFHIYNRSLSANEVLHNYNALKGRFT